MTLFPQQMFPVRMYSFYKGVHFAPDVAARLIPCMEKELFRYGVVDKKFP